MAAKANEIQLTRVYDAPVKLVWDAWTDPKKAARWWGPRGFTITTKSKDLRPGGQWIYTMHGPDGVDYPNIATYHEVVPLRKLVYDHGGNEDRPKLFTVTVTFDESEGRTTMRMTMSFDSAEAAQGAKIFIKAAGGNSTWDRLGEYLDLEQEGQETFVINRTLAADAPTLYELWANPARLVTWLGPTGADMKFLTTNAREGGTSLWSMTTPDGLTKHGQLHYRKFAGPGTLVYAQNFCDAEGNSCRAPFAATYPERLLTTVTFTPETARETRVTVKWEILGPVTEEEKRTFRELKAGMTVGWSQSFDKIDELLAR